MSCFSSFCRSSFSRSFFFANGFSGVTEAFQSRERRLRLSDQAFGPEPVTPPHPTPPTPSFFAFFVCLIFPSGLSGRLLGSFSQRTPTHFLPPLSRGKRECADPAWCVPTPVLFPRNMTTLSMSCTGNESPQTFICAEQGALGPLSCQSRRRP